VGPSTVCTLRRPSVPGGFPDAAASIHGRGVWRPAPDRHTSAAAAEHPGTGVPDGLRDGARRKRRRGLDQ
jgi:hypothetical protein